MIGRGPPRSGGAGGSAFEHLVASGHGPAAWPLCARPVADAGVDDPAGGVPARRPRPVRRPGDDPYVLDRGADGAVLEPGGCARGVPARSGDRARGTELGVPAPVRRRPLDPAARRRRAHPRTPADTAPVPRRAHARVRADDQRARAPGARHLERAGDRARPDAAADTRHHPARRVRSARRGARAHARGDRRVARHRALAAVGAGDGGGTPRLRPAQPVGALQGRGRALRRGAVRIARPPARGGARRFDARAAARGP